MKKDHKKLIDFRKLDALLEGFNKTTGFVTAIVDFEGNILSQSGWRDICTQFHRENTESAKMCIESDTIMANKMVEGKKYHAYKCKNGLMDVAVPLIVNGEHLANIFSGQFFFEKPEQTFFQAQAKLYGYPEKEYLAALEQVPVFSKQEVDNAMNFLLDMTQLISEQAYQKSELIELNQKIEESEEKYRNIFLNSQIGLFRTDIHKGHILECNLSIAKMFGYETRKDFQDNYQESINYVEPERRQEMLKIISEAGEISNFETRFYRKDRSIFWGKYSAKIFPKRGWIEGVFEDITPRKTAEESLRDSENRFHNMLSLVPDMISIQDLEMNIIYSNWNGSEEVSPDRRLVGSKCYQTYRNYNQVCPDCRAVKLIATKEPVWEEIEQEDGVWKEIRMIPMLNAENEIEYFLEWVRDITLRRGAEENLKTTLDEKEMLLRELYHRTKNNMQVITSMLKNQARMHNDDILVQGYYDIVNRINSMSQVHQMLYESEDLSRINLPDYIKDLTRKMRRNYYKQAAKINFVFDMQDIFITIDVAIPLGQILFELILNAFKYSFSEQETGRVEFVLQTVDTEYISLQISDNGKGISDQCDLRDMAGIGLKTVFNLVEYQLQGKISYESQNGLSWQIIIKNDLNIIRI